MSAFERLCGDCVLWVTPRCQRENHGRASRPNSLTHGCDQWHDGAHTPGPWTQHLVKVQRDIVGPSGQSIAYTRGAGWSGDRSEAEELANARLIACAPELFTALLDARGLLVDALRPIGWLEDVIAKATGSAS